MNKTTCGFNVSNNASNNAIINEVLPNLYLSGLRAFDIENLPLFQSYGIKHILCCIPYEEASQAHYTFMTTCNHYMDILYIPYIDYLAQDLWQINNNSIKYTKFNSNADEYENIINAITRYNNQPFMEIAYDFIVNGLSKNEGVLVHCMAGISRSSSVIIYYIMKQYSVNYFTAYNIVRKARPIIRPNNSFTKQLRQFDAMRLASVPTVPTEEVQPEEIVGPMEPAGPIEPVEAHDSYESFGLVAGIPDTYDLQRLITINTQLPPMSPNPWNMWNTWAPYSPIAPIAPIVPIGPIGPIASIPGPVNAWDNWGPWAPAAGVQPVAWTPWGGNWGPWGLI